MVHRILMMIGIYVMTLGSAHAAGEAFVGLGGDGVSSWGRDLALQEILENELGFETVHLNTDTTPGERAELAGAFLSRPGTPGERRLLWLSGSASGSDSPCPKPDAAMITPGAGALILAPGCFADFIRFPAGTLHIALREITGSRPKRLGPETPTAPDVVVITLPSDTPEAIAAADQIVLQALRAASAGGVSPAAILRQLRYGFRVDGSDYTPTLDAAPGPAAWSRRFLVPRIENLSAVREDFEPSAFSARLRWPRDHAVGLFAAPKKDGEPALRLAGDTSITVIRRSRDGAMGFARTAEGLFGWVKLDALD